MSRSIHSSDERQPSIVYYDVELDDAGLNPYQFRIYNRIARRSGGGDHACTESLANMAAGCQMSVRTAIRAVKVLTERRFIRRIKRNGETSHYALLDKSKWLAPMPESHTLTSDYESEGSDSQSQGVCPTVTGVVTHSHDMKNTNKKTIKQTSKTAAAEPFNVDPEQEVKSSNALLSAIDRISAYLCKLYNVPDTAGHTVKGQYQAAAMHLDGVGATLEQIKAFWEYRYKKPQLRYFCENFMDWRVNNYAKNGSNAQPGLIDPSQLSPKTKGNAAAVDAFLASRRHLHG